MNVRPSRRKRTVMLKVIKGALVPTDATSAQMLADRKYKVGDVLSAELRKARNPKFWRMVHQLGVALIENTDDFAEYADAHAVLKRLQVEANIACDVMMIHAPGIGMLEHRTPQSLSFENMEQAEFEKVYSAFCNFVIKKYWNGLDVRQIEEMASLVGLAA